MRAQHSQAACSQDGFTADHACDLFASFSGYRTQARVPEWLWEARAFVGQHAP